MLSSEPQRVLNHYIYPVYVITRLRLIGPVLHAAGYRLFW